VAGGGAGNAVSIARTNSAVDTGVAAPIDSGVAATGVPAAGDAICTGVAAGVAAAGVPVASGAASSVGVASAGVVASAVGSGAVVGVGVGSSPHATSNTKAIATMASKECGGRVTRAPRMVEPLGVT
jgi:hypothetical protein